VGNPQASEWVILLVNEFAQKIAPIATSSMVINGD